MNRLPDVVMLESGTGERLTANEAMARLRAQLGAIMLESSAGERLDAQKRARIAPRPYAYNAGRTFTQIARPTGMRSTQTLAKRDAQGRPLRYNKLCRRIVRGINKRFATRIDRELLELWGDRRDA